MRLSRLQRGCSMMMSPIRWSVSIRPSPLRLGRFFLALWWGGFTPVASFADMGWIIAMGAFGGTAVLFLVASYRMTEPSNLAPFSYFGIPLAFVLGWLFFDEAPWDTLFPGAILIALGGLLIVWRERRNRP